MAEQAGFALPLGTEALERGDFATLVYRLGLARLTGMLELFVPGGSTEALLIHRGHLVTGAIDPLGRLAARRLARLASIAGLRYRFRACTEAEIEAAAASADAGTRPCHLSVWARSHLEAQLDAGRARAMVEELAGVRLALVRRHAPDPSLCDEVDRRILAALQPPRRLHEIWPLSRTSRFRLLSFLHFLSCVGALRIVDHGHGHEHGHERGRGRATTSASMPAVEMPAAEPVSPAPTPAPPRPQPAVPAASPAAIRDARRILGVSENADAEAIRRAYHRRVRALHPDLHPEVSAAQRRVLERELGALTRVYELALGRRRP